MESKTNNIRKIYYILFDVWIVSIFFLIIFKTINIYPISIKDIIKNIFPSTFALNWYITCYLLLYLIYPFLNEIIYKRTKKELLTFIIIIFFFYQGINYIHYGHFFTSPLIEFIVIYFEISYIKLYLIKYTQNIKINIKLFLISFTVTPLIMLITYFLGIHINIFQNKLLHWTGINSPFILVTAICLFNIFKNFKIENSKINFISSTTLLIYIFHENYFVREYLRPSILIYIYKNYSYNNIIMINILISSVIFIISICVAILYKVTIQAYLHKMVDILYKYIKEKTY